MLQVRLSLIVNKKNLSLGNDINTACDIFSMKWPSQAVNVGKKIKLVSFIHPASAMYVVFSWYKDCYPSTSIEYDSSCNGNLIFCLGLHSVLPVLNRNMTMLCSSQVISFHTANLTFKILYISSFAFAVLFASCDTSFNIR